MEAGLLRPARQGHVTDQRPYIAAFASYRPDRKNKQLIWKKIPSDSQL